LKVVVIGGGVIGVHVALRLSQMGYSVFIVEREALGSGLTSRAAGIVTTQLVYTFDIELVKMSMELLEDLAQGSYRKTGFLSVNPESIVKAYTAILDKAGVHYEVFRDSEAADRWDCLTISEDEVVIYTAGDLLLDPGALMSSMRRRLNEAGVEVMEGVEASSLNINGSWVQHVATSVGRIKADLYVITAGPWSRGLLERAEVKLPLKLYRCQVFTVKLPAEIELPPGSDDVNNLYWAPESGKRVLLGNGRIEEVESVEKAIGSVKGSFVEEIAVKASKRIKGVLDAELVTGWSMPCSITPDGIPVVGKVHSLENLYVATGLDGYGLMRGPAIGWLLAELIATGRTPNLLRAMSPNRFGEKSYGDFEIIERHSRLPFEITWFSQSGRSK